MAHKGSGLKLIQEWINAGDKTKSGSSQEVENKQQKNTQTTLSAQSNKTHEYETDIHKLAEQFLAVLRSYKVAKQSDFDWTVKIQLVDSDLDVFIFSQGSELSCAALDEAASAQTKYDNVAQMHVRELNDLVAFKTDLISVMISNIGIFEDKDRKPMELIRPLSDILFGAYNMHFLQGQFSGKLIESIYRDGKVSNFTGSERFIFPWAISSDIGIKLYEVIKDNNVQNSLEIGFAFGLSTLFMCQSHRDKGNGFHTAVDPCQSVEFESIGLSQIEKAGLNSNFRHLESKDYEILPKILESGEKYQFIFIDGLHMQDYVTIDFFYSDLLLDVGGFLAFDDCHAPGVSSAVAYFENNRQYRLVPEYCVLRFRVYEKIGEDNRTITNPNHHVDFIKDYYDLAGVSPENNETNKTSNLGVDAAVKNELVSIVGVDGVFPSDLTVEGFWDAIKNERVMYNRYPKTYLTSRNEEAGSGHFTAGLLSSAYLFDPDYFNISVGEAEIMDPQLRHLFMSVQRAIEDAGITDKQLSDNTVGVYIGAEGSDYNDVHRDESFARNYILHQTGPSLAHRLSYHFNFTGPSEVINTMCSSGAACIERAVNELRLGRIDYAIVAAVKINFIDSIYDVLEGLNITTSATQCFSFHEQSSGYVRSEGVVSLVLTRNSTAKANRDNVYANIMSVATNYNGRDGHSMFTPSKNAQKALVKQCIADAKISVSDISCFEAQGMGNKISDLVEYNLFTEVHNELCEQERLHEFEAPPITTVKPILGHMECVSSLAAILRAILSFETRTLYSVPLLNDASVSSALDQSKGSGALLIGNKQIPSSTIMRIGINSFGASGTNVHMILEEPERSSEVAQDTQKQREQVFVLSAKSPHVLQKFAFNVLSELDGYEGQYPLQEMLAAMQMHRVHHNYRLAIVIPSDSVDNQISILKSQLAAYVDNGFAQGKLSDNIPDSKHHYSVTANSQDTALSRDIDSWLKGNTVDWQKYYPEGLPAKVGRLPSYPFYLQRYALSAPAGAARITAGNSSHTLLHNNVSDLSAQAYETFFTGAEADLQDHQVDGHKVLPAVMYMELVRAAINDATPDNLSAATLQLKDVVWLVPCVVQQPKKVTTTIIPTQGDANAQADITVKFEVSSEGADGKQVHCTGLALIGSKMNATELNLMELKQQFAHSDGADAVSELYRTFSSMGVEYGPSHRCIVNLSSASSAVLADLHQSEATAKHIFLEPGILDSALQATLHLLKNKGVNNEQPGLPFSVEQVNIYAPCEATMSAWVKLSPECDPHDQVLKFDVVLSNTLGQVCVELKNFFVRPLGTNKDDDSSASCQQVQNFENASDATGKQTLTAQVMPFFKARLAQSLRVSVEQVDVDKSFITQGLDSILITQFTEQLKKLFSNITSTLLFEVQTLRGLVDYLIAHNEQEVLKLAGTVTPEPTLGDKAHSPVSAVKTLDSSSTLLRFMDAKPASKEEQYKRTEIAIVGVSGRYPQAPTLDAFWENLCSGANCITEIPTDRWDWRTDYDDTRGLKNKIYSKWGGFLTDIDKFDPLFFKLSPVEAEKMDPQERLFIEQVYHAIEDAGHTAASLAQTNNVGVFVGVMNSMYNIEPDHFSLANRVSFLFDFNGPSMSVDTACSSSLTAIYLAVESIKAGHCEAAIAGGVNLILNSHHYQRLSSMSALSSGRECKAFGVDADGFIDSEGVGAIVLKPLEQAQNDGDHIYGIIKGAALNSGGKTAGYTVPSPLAQQSVVEAAIQSSGISPQDVSYIEAHGTGTALGDPIEVAGLSKAFSTGSDNKQWIALGSVKSNIGHCESAAGIAGVTKILLQMKHKMLVPSLHAEVPNPEINFSNTPFKVQHALSAWEPTPESGRRVAGISSFGLGGANAHIIIEEYVEDVASKAQKVETDSDTIVVLSAASQPQLEQKVIQLQDYINTHPDTCLTSLAYTLQVGREALAHRAAFVASDITQLSTQLGAFAQNDALAQGVFKGEVSASSDVSIEALISQKQWAKLAAKWVNGAAVDWSLLPRDGSATRLSLPVYPFAKERYWAPQMQKPTDHLSAVELHPLVHSNRSNLSHYAYRSRFTGSEFFLANHQIAQQKMMPAAAYIEMIYFAIADMYGMDNEAFTLQLQDVMWGSPFIVIDNHELELRLSVQAQDVFELEIVSFGTQGDVIVHCNGVAMATRNSERPEIDLACIQQRCSEQHISGEKVYQAFKEMSVEIGPKHQGIQSLAIGKEELLGSLSICAEAQESLGYWLHPAMLDSALQSVIGCIENLQINDSQPIVPFCVETVTVYAATESQMLCWIKQVEQTEHSAAFDLILCDSSGKVCAELKGLAAKRITSAPTHKEPVSKMYIPQWQQISDSTLATLPSEHKFEQYSVLLDGAIKQNLESLSGLIADTQIDELAAKGYEEAVHTCIEKLKGIIGQVSHRKHLVQLVIDAQHNDTTLPGLEALLRSAAIENPSLVPQVIILKSSSNSETLAENLLQARKLAQFYCIQFEADKIYVPNWSTLEPNKVEKLSQLKEGGTYLITGGMGGVGQVLASDILSQTQLAKVVLTGRSSEPKDQAAFNALKQVYGSRVIYQQLELSDLEVLKKRILEIESEIGSITGIIHSAGALRDSFIRNAQRQDNEAVLAPKVQGVQHLDSATLHCDLDFFVCCSSVAAVFGNIGQAVYSAANGYLDQFMLARSNKVKQGQRKGKSLSINWPYWQSTGMTLSEQQAEHLYHESGIVAMPQKVGVQIFYQGLQQSQSQILAMYGDKDKLSQSAQMFSSRALQAAPTIVASDVDSAALNEQAISHVTALLATVLKLPVGRITPDASFEDFGMDSILAMELTKHLQETFGPLPKTLFFEYQTTRALAEFIAQSFPDKLGAQSAKKNPELSALSQVSAPKAATTSLLPQREIKHVQRRRTSNSDVAIIGVSGKYPMADDLQAFWDNLQQGRDCIVEIPSQRWNAAEQFDPCRNVPGKTYSKWGGFIDGPDLFDPLFFNISPKEAELMDPQERLVLETAWLAIEDAGYSKDAFAEQTVGVYVGVMWGHYELLGYGAGENGTSVAPSSSFGSIANRVSYFFDFSGPSMALDTMCSSSLTALHQACEDIRHGNIDMALAGGVNLSVHPQKYLVLSQGNFASTDGRCRSFGEGGDGYVPGEGVGIVVLKALDKAQADQDRIHAVIKATSLNHGGKTHGYTVPNPNAQAKLISQSIQKAGIEPNTIGYIEAHGTGTSLGDPIEIRGLSKALGENITTAQSCPIGSVKSNIGHLESAAGIAAVTKAILQFKHKQLVPSLHAESTNPNIDFEQSPFFVQTQLQDWPMPDTHPRRTSISSFGAGGANAHILLDEYETVTPPQLHDTEKQLFVLSAKSKKALVRYAENMLSFLRSEQGRQACFADIAYTAQVGRTAMESRLAIVALDHEDLIDKLQDWLEQTSQRHTLRDCFEGHIKELAGATLDLLEGEAGKAFLDIVMQNKDLAKVAKLWVEGVNIEWSQLHSAAKHKISLPTYPFEKDSYWLKPVAAGIAQAISTPARDVTQTVSRYQTACFTSRWQASQQELEQLPQVLHKPTLVISNNVLSLESLNVEGDLFNLYLQQAEQSHNATHCFMDPSDEHGIQTAIKKLGLDAHNEIDIIYVVNDAEQMQQTTGDSNAFFTLAKLLKGLLGKTIHLVCCYFESPSKPQLSEAALAGLLKSVVKEMLNLSAKLVNFRFADEVSSFSETSWLSLCIGELNTHLHSAQQVMYKLDLHTNSTERFDRVLIETPLPHQTNEQVNVFKQAGNYLITGGLGALGLQFAKYLVETYRANLILVGRSELDAYKTQLLEELRQYGSQVEYLQTDIGDLDCFERDYQSLKSQFGALHGVIHSAGYIKDSLVINKSQADAEMVMQSKVAGTVNLDLVTKDEPLELFMAFTSLAGEIGNVGQSDYAYANCYTDTFVCARNEHVKTGERSGRSLSIAWPHWKEGGMALSESTRKLIELKTGMISLPTQVGIKLTEQILASEESYIVPVYGQIEQIRQALTAKDEQVAEAFDGDTSDLQSLTHTYLKKMISKETKVDVERIDIEEQFDSYGIDSVMITKFVTQLEQDLGDIPNTVFFNNLNIAELADNLLEIAPTKLQTLLAAKPKIAPARVVHAPEAIVSTETHASTSLEQERIAVIGVHGQYPNADSLEQFWAQIKSGSEMTSTVPETRWDAESWFNADPDKSREGWVYSKWGAFLNDIDVFDHEFFNISHDEAVLMDPQERLFLTSAWSAIENAGYTPDELRNQSSKGKGANVGVFVGVTTNTYSLLTHNAWQEGNGLTPSAMPWSLANRVSYILNFNGPSMPVDTACSSSLVAVNLACESLRNQECRFALAGGVNLYTHPVKYLSMCQKGMLSVDDKCRSFGDGGDGFVPAEGVGSLLLRPLTDALANGDHIHCVILGGAHEHSGRSNGYSTPNPQSQASVISRALKNANIEPRSINYVEGHGTGTQLGDSLEVAALAMAFGKTGRANHNCALGSVKSNMGHAESAAGIAGMSKVILQMQHGLLAPSLHSKQLNKSADFEAAGLTVQQALAPWHVADNGVRRAIVNSFGAGGVNACVVIEEFTPTHTAHVDDTARENVMLLSAASESQLKVYAGHIVEYIQAHPEVSLESLCFTLQLGRNAMQHRLAVVADSLSMLESSLVNWLDGDTTQPSVQTKSLPRRTVKVRLDEAQLQQLNTLTSARKMEHIVPAWLEGQAVAWCKMYATQQPNKLALPTYPFSGKKCWVVENAGNALPAMALDTPVQNKGLHPLIGENTSTMKAVCFTSRLSANEYYARDHLVNGQAIYPGSAYLEMGCIASSLVSGEKVRFIKDLIWSSPLTFEGQDCQARTSLEEVADGIEFRITSQTADYETQLHAEGRVVFSDSSEAQNLDLVGIEAFKANSTQVMSKAQFYVYFKDIGFEYRANFQSVEEVYIGHGACLSKLALPEPLRKGAHEYLLHPSLLDGVLQSVSALINKQEVDEVYVPFAVDHIELIKPITPNCYVLTQLNQSKDNNSSKFNSYDMLVLSESGQVLIHIKNFYVRSLGTKRTSLTVENSLQN